MSSADPKKSIQSGASPMSVKAERGTKRTVMVVAMTGLAIAA